MDTTAFGRTIDNLSTFVKEGRYKEVIRAYREEKGLPEGFAFTPEIRKELAERSADYIAKMK